MKLKRQDIYKMTSTSQNFADNDQKRQARNYLVSVANNHFKNSDPGALSMLELLGTGIGADYYLENVKNLGKIDCIEENYKQFMDYNITDSRLSLYNKELVQFLWHDKDAIQYDILNLDFCAYFCEKTFKTKLSTGQALLGALSSKRFKKNSLIFVTFLLNGYQVRVSEYKDDILTDSDVIIKRILEIGKKCGVRLSSTNSTFLYKPEDRGWNKMMHTGFVVNEM